MSNVRDVAVTIVSVVWTVIGVFLIVGAIMMGDAISDWQKETSVPTYEPSYCPTAPEGLC